MVIHHHYHHHQKHHQDGHLLMREGGKLHSIGGEQFVSGLEPTIREGWLLHQRLQVQVSESIFSRKGWQKNRALAASTSFDLESLACACVIYTVEWSICIALVGSFCIEV